mmetsp:Transcript_48634/g.130176  ORF Transcript_48634/g.130176 Transcript_48634/m.130176 type:complete len:182 (-) Transcript_48634:60-605(-)
MDAFTRGTSDTFVTEEMCEKASGISLVVNIKNTFIDVVTEEERQEERLRDVLKLSRSRSDPWLSTHDTPSLSSSGEVALVMEPPKLKLTEAAPLHSHQDANEDWATTSCELDLADPTLEAPAVLSKHLAAPGRFDWRCGHECKGRCNWHFGNRRACRLGDECHWCHQEVHRRRLRSKRAPR